MQDQSQYQPSTDQSSSQQIAHILVAGLWTSDKQKLIRHACETPLEQVDLVGDKIPVDLPELLMGELQVDSRLTAKIWGAPDQWRYDYVNYLVNIRWILEQQENHHRVLGMIVVVDSRETVSSVDEGKLVRLIQSDWSLPYIIVASHPDAPHARHPKMIREQYGIDDLIPMFPCDVSQAEEVNRILIEFVYHVM